MFKLLLSTCCDLCTFFLPGDPAKATISGLIGPPCLRILIYVCCVYISLYIIVCLCICRLNKQYSDCGYLSLDAQLSWMVYYVVYYLLLPFMSLPVPRDPWLNSLSLSLQSWAYTWEQGEAPPRRSPLAANKPLLCPVAGCHRTFFHRPSLYRHKRLCHNMGKGITMADLKHYKKRSELRGFAKLKKFQKSKNNLEVGGWVQVPFG